MGADYVNQRAATSVFLFFVAGSFVKAALFDEPPALAGPQRRPPLERPSTPLRPRSKLQNPHRPGPGPRCESRYVPPKQLRWLLVPSIGPAGPCLRAPQARAYGSWRRTKKKARPACG